MANTDKDILITPNRGSSNEPKIEFKGASSTVGPSTITATIYPTNNGTLSFDGTEGSLFSIANNLTTGSIFSVNPISGIPIIDVNADRTIALNPYGGNTGIGLTNPSYKLDVNGTARFSGQLTIPGNNSILFGPNSTWSRYLRIGGNGWAADSTTASVVTTDGNLHLDAADANHGIYLNWYGGTNGTFFGNGATGQIGRLDGSGNFSVSGTITGTQITSNIANGTAPLVVSSTTKVTNLNADYLDDLDSGSFLRSDADDSASGIIDFLGGSGIYPAVRVRSGGNSWSEGVAIHPASDNGYALTFYRTRASLTDSTNNWAIGNNGFAGTNNFVLLRNGLTGSSAIQPDAAFDVTQAGVFRFGFTPTVGSNTIWHAGNDGSGSGLDADTVDGLNPTSANTASTIVARDGSGNFNAGTLGLTGINIDGANLNNTNDATVYITATNNNDWGLIVDKFNGSATEYGQEIRVASGADYAFSILGSGTRNFRINGAGSVFSNGTVTATYFRDTDDTNYYGDFGNTGTSIVTAGNIGAKTTSPLQALDVRGNFLLAADSTTATHITQKPYTINGGTLSWEGSAGQLFSITNNLTSGSIFSVNDVSGLPSIDVDANGTILLAPYGGNIGVGTLTPAQKLHVVGNSIITGSLGLGIDSAAAKLHTRVSTPTSIGSLPSGVTGILDSSSNNYLLFRNTADNGTYSGIAMQDNNVGGYVIFGNAGGGGDLLYLAGYGGGQLQYGTADSINPSARTTVASWNSTGLQINSGDLRAPIYRDSDDTNFYVNPANGGFYLRGGTSERVTYQTTDSGIYVTNAEGTGTTVRLGAAWGRPGVYNGTYLTLGSEDFIEFRISNTQVGYINSSGYLHAARFLDINDTNYYLDPATDSLLRAVTIRDGGLKLDRAYPNNSIWFAGASDTNHVLWNDYYGGPGARGGAGSGFDGMKWNTYKGIYFRTGSNGQYNSLEISGSGASTNDHQVYLYGANDEKLRTVTTDGIQIQRDLYINGSAGGNYGNRLIVGNTDTSYTAQDGNLRPTIHAHGQYPVVSLNHTVTGNTNHGPTLQFTCNGVGNQFVIGTNGSGTFLSMGYSNAGDWNPHNGIAGYNGISFFHANTSGNIGLGAGGDWGSFGGGDPGYNLHFVGSNNATGGHAAFFDNRVSAVNGSGFLFRNQYGNHSWGIVAEYRVEGTGGADRPSILFSTGYNSNTWSVGYGSGTDDNFRINYDHGHRNSSWGTTAVLVDRSSIMTVSGEVRAPIFRDSNDPSNYYVDPNSTSRINDIYIVGGVAGVSNSSAYHEAAIEVRERGFGGVQDDTWATAPRIGFHWGGRVASQIALASSGRISILNNPGNAFENFQCNDAYVNSVNLPNGFQIQQGGSNYGVFNSWVFLNGTYGFYSSINGAHFYVNDGTYGAWRINGSRDGWRGLNFDNSVVLMMNDNESGHHRNGYGWQFRWADGSLYCHKNGQGGGTSATVWDSVNASRAANSNLMYYQGFTLDANTMESNSTGFTYSVNAPYTGPIVRFSTGGGYDLWLNSPYNSNGYGLAFRTRNGDTASLNSWQYPAVYNVNSNGGGDLYSTRYYDSNDINYYVDPAIGSVLNSLTINGSLNAYANPITVNRINFRSTSGSAQSDPYCLRWMDESSNGGLSWLELQLNDDSNEEFRIYGNSCSGYGCGEISGNLYHRFRADGYAWHAGNLEVGGNVTASAFYGDGSNLTGITAGATLSASSGSQRVVLTSLTSGTMTSAATSSALTFDSSTGTLSSTIFTSTSDITKKTNIQNITNAVELTKQINGIKFDWKETGESSAGVIAQEVEEVLPEIVHTNDEGIKSVNYNGVVGLLVEAIKEQQKQIDELKKELKKLHK